MAVKIQKRLENGTFQDIQDDKAYYAQILNEAKGNPIGKDDNKWTLVEWNPIESEGKIKVKKNKPDDGGRESFLNWGYQRRPGSFWSVDDLRF